MTKVELSKLEGDIIRFSLVTIKRQLKRNQENFNGLREQIVKIKNEINELNPLKPNDVVLMQKKMNEIRHLSKNGNIGLNFKRLKTMLREKFLINLFGDDRKKVSDIINKKVKMFDVMKFELTLDSFRHYNNLAAKRYYNRKVKEYEEKNKITQIDIDNRNLKNKIQRVKGVKKYQASKRSKTIKPILLAYIDIKKSKKGTYKGVGPKSIRESNDNLVKIRKDEDLKIRVSDRQIQRYVREMNIIIENFRLNRGIENINLYLYVHLKGVLLHTFYHTTVKSYSPHLFANTFNYLDYNVGKEHGYVYYTAKGKSIDDEDVVIYNY